MSEMRFESQGDEFGRPPERGEGFDISAKLVRWGLVSSTKEGQYVLIGVAVLIVLVAGYFFFTSGGSSTPPLLPQ